VSQYQKGKTSLDITEARDSEWQWHQLGHMQVCTLLQTDNHASTPPLSFFTGPMPFLPPNQQRQSTPLDICIYIYTLFRHTGMDQAADRAKAAAVDHYFSSSAENIFVPVSLWMPSNRLMIVL